MRLPPRPVASLIAAALAVMVGFCGTLLPVMVGPLPLAAAGAGGAGLVGWMTFPFLGQSSGAIGWPKDIAFLLIAVLLAGALIGALVIPSVGAVMGIAAAFSAPFLHPLLTAAYMLGGGLWLWLARRA